MITLLLLLAGLASPPALGTPLPAFKSIDLMGRDLDIQALKGQPVLINLWASWCQPCTDEMPVLQALSERYGPRGLQVVGISLDDDPLNAAATVRAQKLTYRNVVDPGQRSVKELGMQMLPTTYIYDAKGTLRLHHAGLIKPNDPKIIKVLDALLPAKKPTP